MITLIGKATLIATMVRPGTVHAERTTNVSIGVEFFRTTGTDILTVGVEKNPHYFLILTPHSRTFGSRLSRESLGALRAYQGIYHRPTRLALLIYVYL